MADLLPYREWQRKGKKGALDRAKERMNEILETQQPVPLLEEQEKEIQRILQKAKEYYTEKGLL